MRDLRLKARDHARNPVQWDDTRNAGFSLATNSNVEPWMRVNEDYKEWNVAKQQGDDQSVLSFWKKMLTFRKKHLSCVSVKVNQAYYVSFAEGWTTQTYGIYTLLSPDDEKVYSYTKDYKTERTIVLLNFSKTAVSYDVPAEAGSLETPSSFIGNYSSPNPTFKDRRVNLRPYEAMAFVTARDIA